MSSDPRTFYITTPIYYVNDRPHIGHAYTTTVCDVAARFGRFLGRDVFFLTGTDEHGIKVEKSAAAQGIAPQALADQNAAEFQRVLGMFGLTNDDFIRTTQPRHVVQVQRFVKRLIDSGDIYLGEYEGWYDEGQEEFVPEKRAAEQEFKSVVSGNPLVRMREENFFFRLSNYQERLERLYAGQPEFVRPEARRNEMLGRLREGLADVPVSRTSFRWGIPVPGHDKHVLWVWLDALSNYITTLGLGLDHIAPGLPGEDAAGDIGADPAGKPGALYEQLRDRRKYWPADYHVIGKEILFFHALFWPAVLMALDLPLPRCIYAHSFWIAEGRKMSKSLGNFIDQPAMQRYIDEFGFDALRWYLVTQGPLGSTDTDFSRAKFIEVYNSELANTFGNSLNRVVNMIGRYFDGRVPEDVASECYSYPVGQDELAPPSCSVEIEESASFAGFDWCAITADAVSSCIRHMERLELGPALQGALGIVRQVDAYIDATKPFAMAKDPTQRGELGIVLYNCAEALRIATILLWCAMPGRMEQAWRMLGQTIDPARGNLLDLTKWGGLKPGTPLVKGEGLFPRYTET